MFFSDGKWKRCGGVSPNVNKLAAPYAFDCGIVGSKVRVTRNHHTWFTIGELEVFGPQVGPVEPKCDGSMSISKKKTWPWARRPRSARNATRGTPPTRAI